jgi:hypothetical protein
MTQFTIINSLEELKAFFDAVDRKRAMSKAGFGVVWPELQQISQDGIRHIERQEGAA